MYTRGKTKPQWGFVRKFVRKWMWLKDSDSLPTAGVGRGCLLELVTPLVPATHPHALPCLPRARVGVWCIVHSVRAGGETKTN